MDKRLVTIKKANELIGISQAYVKQLLRERRLTRYKVGRSTYVSLTEFESLAQPASAG